MARPDHLGDVLLSLPAAAALRSAFPHAEVTVLVRSGLEDVARLVPEVDGVLALPFPAPDAGQKPPGWEDVVRREAPRLRGTHDAALLLRPGDPWSGSLLESAAVPVRIGLDRPETVPFLTHVVREPSAAHATSLVFLLAKRAARVFGASVDGSDQPVRLAPRPRDVRAVSSLLGALGPEVGSRPAVLHPGSGWPLKNWPPSRWAALARALAERRRRWALVVGGPGEEGLVRRVAAQARGVASPVLGLSVGELAALHARAALVVSTDSGALHMAALSGAPVVGIYGPGDPVASAPLAAAGRTEIVRIDLPCSPCGTMTGPPCGAASDPACVTGVPVEAVLAACDRVAGDRAGV